LYAVSNRQKLQQGISIPLSERYFEEYSLMVFVLEEPRVNNLSLAKISSDGPPKPTYFWSIDPLGMGKGLKCRQCNKVFHYLGYNWQKSLSSWMKSHYQIARYQILIS
jgi:hypothetical protein